MFRTIGVFALILLSFAFASAQEPPPDGDGRGVIIETIPFSTAADIALNINPISCLNSSCERLADLLFPTLYDFDAATGEWIGAASDNTALVLDAVPTLDAPQTLRLRDDLVWSDGTPVTAYDVLFTLLGYADVGFIDIDAIRLVDDYTLSVSLTDADCSTPRRLNVAVLPSHFVTPAFRPFIDDNSALSWLSDWRTAWRAVVGQTSWYASVFGSYLQAEQLPTAGRFVFDAARPRRDLRLIGSPHFNPDLAFVYADRVGGVSATEGFLRGDSNLLVNPPYDRRDDLRATDDIRIDETDSYAADWLIFNLTDPSYARNGYGDDGEPLEQIPHPIFNDIRVRRAVQLAIDVDQIIETVFYGNAVPIASYVPPVSWAYDANLPPIGYDPIEAARLLFEAGWRDTDGDGLLECITCALADLFRGRDLAVFLSVGDDPDRSREQVANVIASQLREVGFTVNIGYEGGIDQDFDMLLTGTDRYPDGGRDPNQWQAFSRAGDLLGEDVNVGSYNNPRVEELFDQARRMSDCNRAERAAIYHEIQAILQADQPAAWLYARREMVVSRGITGIAPRPGDVFWNVLDWRVNE